MSVSFDAVVRSVECWDCGQMISKRTYRGLGCPFCGGSDE